MRRLFESWTRQRIVLTPVLLFFRIKVIELTYFDFDYIGSALIREPSLFLPNAALIRDGADSSKYGTRKQSHHKGVVGCLWHTEFFTLASS